MSQQQPLFYSNPVPLHPERHAATGLRSGAGFGFAAKANGLPLVVGEMAAAAADYPVVFTAQAPYMPLAVVGVRPGSNLFVDPKGRWEKGRYVPAYVRRYPFIFATAPDGKLVLCVDEAAPTVGPAGADKLFVDGKMSKVTERALQLCTEYQREAKATEEFCAALQQHGLFEPNTVEGAAQGGGGAPLRVTGFMGIDPKRFDALPDAVFLEFRRRGWLPAVYAQFAARGRWSALMEREAAARK